MVRILALVVVGDQYAVNAFFQSLRRQHPYVRTDDAAMQTVPDDRGCQCSEKAKICLLEPIEEDHIPAVLALAGSAQVAACPCTE